jgi:hypothetical protein
MAECSLAPAPGSMAIMGRAVTDTMGTMGALITVGGLFAVISAAEEAEISADLEAAKSTEGVGSVEGVAVDSTEPAVFMAADAVKRSDFSVENKNGCQQRRAAVFFCSVASLFPGQV